MPTSRSIDRHDKRYKCVRERALEWWNGSLAHAFITGSHTSALTYAAHGGVQAAGALTQGVMFAYNFIIRVRRAFAQREEQPHTRNDGARPRSHGDDDDDVNTLHEFVIVMLHWVIM